jgi:hypothetical protein
MEREKDKAIRRKSTKQGFDSASVLFTVFAVVFISIGIYINIQNTSAVGISQPGRHGQGGGTVLNISGLFVVGIGLLFAAFPVADLIRYFNSRH